MFKLPLEPARLAGACAAAAGASAKRTLGTAAAPYRYPTTNFITRQFNPINPANNDPLLYRRLFFSRPSFHNTSNPPSTCRRPLTSMATSTKYPLLCLENPLLDIIAKADQAFLDKYQLVENTTILVFENETERLKIFDDLLAKEGVKESAGGAAQNTARGAQYILPPNSTVFLGAVGKDKYADHQRAAVDKEGVHVEYQVVPDVPTGRCAVVVTNDKRTMVTELGAANHYSVDHMKQPHIWALVEAAEAYFVGGYHFSVSPEAILLLAKQAASKDKPFILSISSDFVVNQYQKDLTATLPYVDYLVGNEKEAEAFGQKFGILGQDVTEASREDLRKIAKQISNLPKENPNRKRVSIITHGDQPTIVAIQGEDEVKEYPVHKIAREEIADTIGAGDAFAGGLSAGIIEGKSLEESIHLGAWLARLSLTQVGASYPFPKKTYPSSS